MYTVLKSQTTKIGRIDSRVYSVSNCTNYSPKLRFTESQDFVSYAHLPDKQFIVAGVHAVNIVQPLFRLLVLKLGVSTSTSRNFHQNLHWQAYHLSRFRVCHSVATVAWALNSFSQSSHSLKRLEST